MAIEESGAPIAVAYVEVRADMTKYDAAVRSAAGRTVPVYDRSGGTRPVDMAKRRVPGTVVFADPQIERKVQAEETRIVQSKRKLAQAVEDTARSQQRIADISRAGAAAIDIGKARAVGEQRLRDAILAAGGFQPGEIKIRGGGRISLLDLGATGAQVAVATQAAEAIRMGSLDYARGVTTPPPFSKSTWARSADAANAARAAQTLEAMKWEKNVMNTFGPVPFKESSWAAASNAANAARARATTEAMRWEEKPFGSFGAGNRPSQHWRYEAGAGAVAGAMSDKEYATALKALGGASKSGVVKGGLTSLFDLSKGRHVIALVARSASITAISRFFELTGGVARYIGAPGMFLATGILAAVHYAKEYATTMQRANAAAKSLSGKATELDKLTADQERYAQARSYVIAGPGTIAWRAKRDMLTKPTDWQSRRDQLLAEEGMAYGGEQATKLGRWFKGIYGAMSSVVARAANLAVDVEVTDAKLRRIEEIDRLMKARANTITRSISATAAGMGWGEQFAGNGRAGDRFAGLGPSPKWYGPVFEFKQPTEREKTWEKVGNELDSLFKSNVMPSRQTWKTVLDTGHADEIFQQAHDLSTITTLLTEINATVQDSRAWLKQSGTLN